jgi:hypothetical protein
MVNKILNEFKFEGCRTTPKTPRSNIMEPIYYGEAFVICCNDAIEF